MTRSITPEEAQLARIAWVLTQGAKAAGIPLNDQTAQRLTMSMHKCMLADPAMVLDALFEPIQSPGIITVSGVKSTGRNPGPRQEGDT